MWAVVGGLLAAGTGLVLSNGEAAATVSGAAGALADVHWAVVPVLAVLVGVHFWFSAVALGGAAGRRLPLLHATMAQFTAATANRITGGGVGTVAVNARYLSARGVPASHALTVAGVLQVGGAFADLILFAVMLPVAMTAGDGLLLAHLAEHLRDMARPLLIVAAVAAIPAGAAVWLLREKLSGPVTAGARLLRRPRDLAVMLAASAATTLVMGVAFALSMLAVPGAVSWDQFGTLIVVYMIGAAAGGVVPGPGGLGSTEAALVALLAATGVETAGALSGVLVFRAVTHWAPVPIGLLAVATVGNRRRIAPASVEVPEQRPAKAVRSAA
ncbi:lysylphosphatidylglycerol synthase transmembrane domain-containing protein [Thermomonospora amylolytica]|uniref:lysylphosphatidylglycerol synthase transmembrane domain-containing protein n=1 Tax=Thermomonospora amylolytica TaxID=1411117 RepID=UPI0013003B28|nr:lysylphosphatidylglycerol synthase domain-containing protein [Thermomonospora amylolytica]